MLAAVCASLAIFVAAAPGSLERGVKRATPAAKSKAKPASSKPKTSPVKQKAPSAKPPHRPSELTRARAALAEVKRDPAKRRYRHHWEKAIASLERSARGSDTAPALLDAARARYALYRFSQVDSDRTKALALASRAEKAGAREARAFRLAVREEMGESPEREHKPPRRPTTMVTRAAEPPAPRRESPPARPAVPSVAPTPPAHASTPTPLVGPLVIAPTPLARARPSPAAPEPVRRNPPPSTPGEEEASIDAILERALAGEGAPGAPASVATHARVAEIKSWSNLDYTRVAIYLSRHVAFQRVDLPEQPDRPRQVAIDLRPAKLDSAIVHAVGDALVQRVRAIQVDNDSVRVTMDLSGREDLTIFPLEEPARLLVDVGAAVVPAPPAVASTPAPYAPDPGPRRTDSASQPPPAPMASPGAPPVLPPSEEFALRGPIRRVIVDAGHGGHDTGAIGPTNVREKDVTLAMAKRLAKRLRARGYEVVLTRDDDRYLALEERTAIANARHGDLFVSLHANAHPRRDRHGVETYILNVSDDRYARRLAARENGAFDDAAADIPLLRRILSDLDAKVSVESSRRVAAAVQRELCSGIRARFGDVRDLGVKSALFYVLLGARMPAVLVETAFISNRAEEKRLASAAFQEEVAAAVVRAVERVGSADPRLAAAR